MRVELGNPTPHHKGSINAETGARQFEPLPGPAVTHVDIPDDYTFNPDVNVDELVREMFRAQQTGGVTSRPDDEVLLVFLHWDGFWTHHGKDMPSWVSVTGPDAVKNDGLERVLADYYGCARGVPDDVEATHYTRSGPPGVGV